MHFAQPMTGLLNISFRVFALDVRHQPGEGFDRIDCYIRNVFLLNAKATPLVNVFKTLNSIVNTDPNIRSISKSDYPSHLCNGNNIHTYQCKNKLK